MKLREYPALLEKQRGYIGIGDRRIIGGVPFVIPVRNLAARFDAGLGVTAAGGFVSQHNDISGYARHRTQATGANQSIHLPFSGTKYAWLPAVNGNYFSTNDSVALSITGAIDVRVKCAPSDWTPSALQILLGKYVGAGNRSFGFYLNTTGSLRFFWSQDGTTAHIDAQSTAVVGFTDGSTHWVRATADPATTTINFYTSEDGVVWTQLGATVTTGAVSAIFDSAAALEVGSYQSGAAGNTFSGAIYQAQVYSGIAGTLVADFDPSRWSSGTTFTASTGETWTINSTGSKPAQIVDRASLLFDGTAHKMATADFGLVQPYVRILVARTPTHTVGDVLADGLTLNTGALRQTTASPKLSINAGASACETSMTLGAWKVITAVVNGASSSLRENLGTPTTGDAGAGNPGGLMIGADGGGANYGNLQYTDELVYSAVPSEAVLQNIIRALMNKRGIT